MVLSLALVSGVLAQGGLTYTSGVQVVNLDAVNAASIQLIYYDQATGNQVATVNDTVPAGGSKTYFPLTGVTNFNGSMVISSNTQIAAIANTITPTGDYEASTTGFSGGSTSFNLPLVMCNNSGFNTFFNVQNAGTADANITINYIPAGAGVSGQSEIATIKVGAAKTFDQQIGSSTKNCTQLADGTGKFVGGAQITSNQPVVATVMQLNSTTFRILMGYNGFAAGSGTVELPLIMANNNGFYTGVQVQNTGTASTNVTLDYSPNNVSGGNNPTDETFTLAAGASKTILQAGAPPGNGSVNNWGTVGKYVGAATVTNNNGQPMVAIVNQVYNGSPGFGPVGTAYEGFNPATATANISTPLIMSNNSGFYTGVQVQNVGAANCPSVTIDYGPNTGGAGNPVNEVFSLNAKASWTVIQSGAPPGNNSANNWTTIGKYVGSAEISAPGCTIIAIVNEIRVSTGDWFMTYTGINH